MAISSSDLRFFAAQFANDESYGGGLMSANIVQDNVSKNVFPLYGESDAANGRLQLRKLYAAVLSANDDTLINAAVDLWTPPTDAEVDVLMFRQGDQTTVRSEAAAALAKFPFRVGAISGGVIGSGGNPLTLSGATLPAVGDKILLGLPTSLVVDGMPITVTGVVKVTAVSGGSVTVDYGTGGAVPSTVWYSIDASTLAPRVHGPAAIASAASASATSIQVSRVDGRVVPNLTPYPTTPNGIDSSGLRLTRGTVPIFRPGDAVVIRNAAGTTSELASVVSINYVTNTLQLAAPLANSYSSGFVTSLMSLGDLRAEVGSVFSQQTWTRVFSSSIIGSPISANYNLGSGSITVTNEGAETERWAFVFTSATDFKLIGETIGQIASGSIGTAFAPLNPRAGRCHKTRRRLAG